MTRLMDRPSTQAIAQARERFARRHRRRRALLGLFTTVVICAALVFAAAVTVAQPLWITDDAMAPTLEAGTLVLYSSWNYAPARGDVVVSTVESPEGGMLVRRIIGLPGAEQAKQALAALLKYVDGHVADGCAEFLQPGRNGFLDGLCAGFVALHFTVPSPMAASRFSLLSRYQLMPMFCTAAMMLPITQYREKAAL